jgi:F-type H+-transporting ATPase subunit b
MEIFEIFGIDGLVVLAQVVNFIVILYILKRFAYKPLFNVIKKREDLVKETVEKAEEQRKALEKTEIEEKKILKKASETASQIVKDAKEEAASIIAMGQEKTKNETTKMVAEAKAQIEIERKEVETKLLKDVTGLSVEVLRKSLSKILTDKEQDEVVKRAITVLQKQSN